MSIQNKLKARFGIDNSSNTIINVADPVNAQDAATKNFSSNGSNITTGTVAPARLGSGSPSSSNYLRGDGTWSTVVGGSGINVSNTGYVGTNQYLLGTPSTTGSISTANVSISSIYYDTAGLYAPIITGSSSVYSFGLLYSRWLQVVPTDTSNYIIRAASAGPDVAKWYVDANSQIAIGNFDIQNGTTMFNSMNKRTSFTYGISNYDWLFDGAYSYTGYSVNSLMYTTTGNNIIWQGFASSGCAFGNPSSAHGNILTTTHFQANHDLNDATKYSTTTYGFYSNITANTQGLGTQYNFYAATSAPNYFTGNVSVGGTISGNGNGLLYVPYYAPVTFGGTGTPTVGNDKTPWVRVPTTGLCQYISLTAKTAPSGGPLTMSILYSKDGGTTFPTTIGTVQLATGQKSNTILLSPNPTVLEGIANSSNLFRLDISAVNGAADWTAILTIRNTGA